MVFCCRFFFFCQECPYRKILPQTPELGPDTGIWICLDSYYIFWMLGIISLLTSPQWPRYLTPKWNYVQFSVFGPKWSHIEIRPCIHKFGLRSLDFKFFNNYYISRFWKWFRFEKALKDLPIIILTHIMSYCRQMSAVPPV